MLRLLFQKTGNSIWISHLDLMRVFQRSFQRAGLPLTHTKGFNPRPSVSIALPLSVGIESRCELLDFDLEGENHPPVEKIRDLLNEKLIAGVRVLQVYEGGSKIKNLALLRSVLTLEYDAGVAEGTEEKLKELFSRESLVVSKKGKGGKISDQDLIPMIRELSIRAGEKEVELELLGCCQNPTLNPMQLPAAIEKYLPEIKPDFVTCRRVEIYDTEENIFR